MVLCVVDRPFSQMSRRVNSIGLAGESVELTALSGLPNLRELVVLALERLSMLWSGRVLLDRGAIIKVGLVSSPIEKSSLSTVPAIRARVVKVFPRPISWCCELVDSLPSLPLCFLHLRGALQDTARGVGSLSGQ